MGEKKGLWIEPPHTEIIRLISTFEPKDTLRPIMKNELLVLWLRINLYLIQIIRCDYLLRLGWLR